MTLPAAIQFISYSNYQIIFAILFACSTLSALAIIYMYLAAKDKLAKIFGCITTTFTILTIAFVCITPSTTDMALNEMLTYVYKSNSLQECISNSADINSCEAVNATFSADSMRAAIKYYALKNKIE